MTWNCAKLNACRQVKNGKADAVCTQQWVVVSQNVDERDLATFGRKRVDTSLMAESSAGGCR